MSRIARLGWRRLLLGAVLLGVLIAGLWTGRLYRRTVRLIAEREQALASAVFSAPLFVSSGQDIVALRLLERLANSGYVRVGQRPAAAGEYALLPGEIEIYKRGFRWGARWFPPARVYLTLSGSRVLGAADGFGLPLGAVALEPEVIGRLLPDAPVERSEVALSDLKPYVLRGLLAVEDRYFYYHPGFDPVRIIEAALVDLRAGRASQGASTITQQLARTLLKNRTRSMGRKLEELAVSLTLELRLSKDRILERYINDVPMGEYDGTPIYGLQAAARYFFNQDLREVSPAQAATLIGMIRAPTLYDPRRHPKAALSRRDHVLGLMLRQGVIDESTYRQALAAGLLLAQAPRLRRAPYFTDYVAREVRRALGDRMLGRGIKVYTTLYPEWNSLGQQAMDSSLRRLEERHPRLRVAETGRQLEGALLAVEPSTGAIRAMVGGRDYGQSQFNRAVLALRQPGSTFKPVVYAAALDPARTPLRHPLTLATLLPDRPMSFNGWRPVNYEHTYAGQVTVVDALARSLNVPTAYVGSLLGPERIVRMARELGVVRPLPAVLPLALGAGEVSLLELAGVYQVLANGGLAHPPYGVEAVTDAGGRLLYQHNLPGEQRMSPAVAYLVTGALEQVMRFGTAAAAGQMGISFPAAGKTGTTERYHDAYFVGYTPNLVCAVWVGFDRPRSLGLTGAQAGLPVWAGFMRAVTGPDSPSFARPPGVVIVAIDPQSGGLATASCPRVVRLPFLAGTAPTVVCPLHGGTVAARAIAGTPRGAAPAVGTAEVAPRSATNGFFSALTRLLGF